MEFYLLGDMGSGTKEQYKVSDVLAKHIQKSKSKKLEFEGRFPGFNSNNFKLKLDEKKFNFLYEDENNCHFMDQTNFEQIQINKSLLGEKSKLLKENMNNILDFIHKQLEENNIFIYCYNGVTVSPLIVALYMIKKGNVSQELIHDILRSKNKEICLDFDLSYF